MILTLTRRTILLDVLGTQAWIPEPIGCHVGTHIIPPILREAGSEAVFKFYKPGTTITIFALFEFRFGSRHYLAALFASVPSKHEAPPTATRYMLVEPHV